MDGGYVVNVGNGVVRNGRGVMDSITPRKSAMKRMFNRRRFRFEKILEDGFFDGKKRRYGMRLEWENWKNVEEEEYDDDLYKKWVKKRIKTGASRFTVVWKDDWWIEPVGLSNLRALEMGRDFIEERLESADESDSRLLRARKKALKGIEERLDEIMNVEYEWKEEDKEIDIMLKVKMEGIKNGHSLPGEDPVYDLIEKENENEDENEENDEDDDDDDSDIEILN